MASKYSLSAELPATRKSLRRGNTQTQYDHQLGVLREQASNNQPAEEKISVTPHDAWAQPTPPAPAAARGGLNTADAMVRRDLSLRRGVSRGKGKGAAAAGEETALKSEFDSSDVTYDERGYLVLKGADRYGLTSSAFSTDKTNDEGRKRTNRFAYLEGLRGVLGLQVLIWTFFRIFAPAIVADRDVDGVYPAAFVAAAPTWQTVLRKALSPLLFDGELQAAMFVILTGRASLQTYIERRVATGLAGPAFKRPFRFLIPMAVTLALVSLVIGVNGFRYASEMSSALQNQHATPPVQWGSALEYFNSLLFFFSSPLYFKTARATTFIPPSGTLWIIPVIFQQTYVLIILAFALPYTIMRYKNLGMILLILTTAWVGRWSWYTLTGLLLAEWSTVYLQLLPAKGIPLNRQGTRFVPTWVPGVAFALLGTMFKYLWIAAVPAKANNDIIAHVDGNTGRLNYGVDPSQVAFPRYDNWLLATGVLYLIEISPRAQKVLGNRVFVHIGRWAFSIALISGTLMLSLGSFVWHHLTASTAQGGLAWTSEAGILGVLFVILIPASCLLAEAYSRAVDDSALWLANWMFKWIRV
ncbi:uncharacterized protein PAN0_012c4461 [Moesziomyces antarcticus]|uniref:Uncharacterized protein n=2 Tax=Pseudozyma antarctica TaxID=84753 RepID=A0A081CHU3_PSEA2|nr:uncharacterized protein PAN0_012c4461 [Moesziomyces antarcticus]GAK66239.1 conserved hypothetical protein [Moesziomyces antarcticus]SPO48571.1 uncharacterized protein PSANT_06262 [Moesziomyces antarcticus]